MSSPVPPHDLLALAPDAQDLLFREARTANAFTDQPISQDQINAVHDLVKYGPTGVNGQPLRLLMLGTNEARARLLPHLLEGNRDKTANAPLVAVLAADLYFHEHLPRLLPFRPEMKNLYEGSAGGDVLRTETALFNSALQAAYFIIGVRAAGLAAGPMSGFDRPGVDREFFPDGRHRSILVVNIGVPRPDASFPRLLRLSADEVITWL
ncbi:malonic semialdehyde reductase [Streptomyces sp. NPDC093600]|uniref:malonic semialdehyde reductase n=1 Tax=Streptomyces sp. NPDC093600 TaxID=3366047 RepID=UPI0037FF8B4A